MRVYSQNYRLGYNGVKELGSINCQLTAADIEVIKLGLKSIKKLENEVNESVKGSLLQMFDEL